MALVSLESSSCEVPCLILHSVVYRDVTRQAKGLYRLKYVGALKSGLAYLSGYSSGCFCHTGHVPSTGRPRRSKPCHLPPWRPRRCFPGSRRPLLLSPRRAAVARATTTPAGCQLLLPRDHAFFWTPSTSWSYPCIPSCLHTTTFP
jgi:hypothetical protein